MVKHIVLFKLKESLTSAEKADVMNRFKAFQGGYRSLASKN